MGLLGRTASKEPGGSTVMLLGETSGAPEGCSALEVDEVMGKAAVAATEDSGRVAVLGVVERGVFS